ncbi:hypothetical protein DNFV4_03015 [Nitrospira tepida]|uniref:Uncharacterized protein n=1 Tax=Nitrospira tepida TaxID=2973512 RepID=A0AA86N104_9BACT|nr:hypothetical protein DNFV4_03015 [Nitrospira tepida]
MMPINDIQPHSFHIKESLHGQYSPSIFKTHGDRIDLISLSNLKELVKCPNHPEINQTFPHMCLIFSEKSYNLSEPGSP